MFVEFLRERRQFEDDSIGVFAQKSVCILVRMLKNNLDKAKQAANKRANRPPLIDRAQT